MVRVTRTSAQASRDSRAKYYMWKFVGAEEVMEFVVQNSLKNKEFCFITAEYGTRYMESHRQEYAYQTPVRFIEKVQKWHWHDGYAEKIRS